MSEIKTYPMSQWYVHLYENAFPAVFLSLTEEEIEAMKHKETDSAVARALLVRLSNCMKSFPGNKFVSVDTAAPTDTERFASKRGAVYSAASALKYLLESEKVAQALEMGLVHNLCIRPFRNMQMAREFRLFVKDSQLVGMSQYYLVRHFRRLPGRQEKYWKMAQEFVAKIADKLPEKTLCIDIYFKSSGSILIVDLNPWGAPTDPLMYNSWDRDWSGEGACLIVPVPKQVSGDVKVKF